MTVIRGFPRAVIHQIVEKLLEHVEVCTGISYQEYAARNEEKPEAERDSWDKLVYTGMMRRVLRILLRRAGIPFAEV